jgi:hypothetical protein
MKEFPYLEEIYDMETGKLSELLDLINTDMALGQGSCVVPGRFESFEKYQKKALKMKESLELELEERGQVDNVLSFFLQVKGDKQEDTFLDDDEFFKPLGIAKQDEEEKASGGRGVQE